MSKLDIALIQMFSPAYQTTIHNLLEDFQSQENIRPNLQILKWSTAWAEMMKIHQLQQGAIVTEAGDTWMGTLAALNGLRRFMRREVTAIGDGSAFPRAMWRSCIQHETNNVIAIPWTLKSYVVYYRTDLLEKVGIDPAAAFDTPEHFIETLEKLRTGTDIAPFVVPTLSTTFDTLHNSACWIWGLGGDFLNPNATQTRLSDPFTRAGLRKYFDIHRFITPAMQLLDEHISWNLFLDGQVAVTIRETTLLRDLLRNSPPRAITGKFGVATMPGIPLVGGSNLLIWKHATARQRSAAVKFVKFLTSEKALISLFENTGMFPARLTVLEQLQSPYYAPVIESFTRGRAFHRQRVWGLVENRLAPSLNNIWNDLFQTPSANVDAIISRHLDPLEEELAVIIAQFETQ